MKIRDPQGVSAILARLNRHRKQENGEVSYFDINLDWYITILHTNFSIDKIHHDVLYSIIFRSLFTPNTNNCLEINSFKILLKNKIDEFLDQPLRPFLVRGFISAAGTMPFKKIKIVDGSVDFSRGRKFRDISPEHLRNPLFYGDLPRNFRPVVVSIKTRTIKEAVDYAIEKIDIIRAIWNIHLNYAQRTTFGRPQPINRITLGPVFSVHLPNGRFTENGVWQNNAFVPPSNPITLDQYQDVLKKRTRLFLNVIRNKPIGRKIQDALIKYTRALDHINFDNSLVEMWSIIESLACAERNTSHRQIVDRAAAIYRDKHEARIILEHLRARRNEIVHRNTGFKDAENTVYQAKMIVEDFIFFYVIFASKYLENEKEIIQFLQLPRDKKLLRSGLRFGSAA